MKVSVVCPRGERKNKYKALGKKIFIYEHVGGDAFIHKQ